MNNKNRLFLKVTSKRGWVILTPILEKNEVKQTKWCLYRRM